MDVRAAKELAKARQNVKRKLQALKSDIIQSEIHLQKQFKPITEPLKELIANVKNEGIIAPKQEYIEKEYLKKELSPQTPLPIRRDTDRFVVSQSSTPLPPETPRSISSYQSIGSPQAVSLDFLDTETIVEDVPIPTLAHLQHELSQAEDSPEFEEYLRQYKGMARAYVEGMFRDVASEYDHLYGVRFIPETDEFRIGDSKLTFLGEDLRIHTPSGGQFDYEGTPGLYELIFKKWPIGVTSRDKTNYKDILIRTNASRRNYNAALPLVGTGDKYRNIIKELMQDTLRRTPRTSHQRAKTMGTGMTMLQYNNKKTEYVPWKDPNKLVDRLRILLSSKSAGHTGHSNEIVSIVDELRTSKIIK